MQILQSASKLVFLSMTLAAIALTFFGILAGDDFMLLIGMVFGYYFKNATSAVAPEEKEPEVDLAALIESVDQDQG